MNCPKCGNPVALKERICPSCKYFAEQDRYVTVAPQVASERRPPRHLSWLARFRLGSEARRVQAAKRFWGMRWPFRLLAGIVPGLGHLIIGDWRRAGIYFALVAGLLMESVSHMAGIGPIMIGVAAVVHSYSMFEHLPEDIRQGLLSRVAAIGVLLAILLTYIYTPLNENLTRLLAPQQIRPGRAWVFTVNYGLTAFYLALFVFGVAWVAGIAVSALRERRGSHAPRGGGNS